MKYITKVENWHIVEISGEHHKVREEIIGEHSMLRHRRFTFKHVVVKSNLEVQSGDYTHLATIVLAVEVARFILENEAK